MRSLVLGLVLMSSVSVMAKELTYNADPAASKVGWLGKKVTGEHSGLITLKKGSLKFNDKNFVGGEFEVDMTTISNTDLKDAKYNSDLVGHLKSPDFFNVAQFPAATLKIKSVSKVKGNNYKIVADLTIKGITNEVTYNADVVDSAKAISAKGKIIFDRTKYKIEYKSGKFVPNLGDKLIYDDVELSVDLAANK